MSLDQAGKTKVSTINLPSGPLSTTTFPPGPESKVRLSASVCGWIGLAAICARNAATGSAGGALCCCAGKGTAARSNEAGKSCARKAPPVSVTVAEHRAARSGHQKGVGMHGVFILSLGVGLLQRLRRRLYLNAAQNSPLESNLLNLVSVYSAKDTIL